MMKRVGLGMSIALVAWTTACGSGGTGGSGGSGGGNGGSGGGPSLDSFTVEFGPVTVPSGVENTQCVVKKIGNLSQIRVGKIHNELFAGSHHLIVYRTNDTVEQPTPFDCQPFVDTLNPAKGAPLMITQKADEVLTLPDGVAFSLAADQMVRIEMHYINTTSNDLEIKAKTTFYQIAEDKFQNEADFLFLGNPDINIAPHATAQVGPTFIPLPAELSGVNVFGLTGHTHHFGTNVTIASADSKAGPDTMLYDIPNWQWSEPDTVFLKPPVSLPSGGGFRFTCNYNNTSDNNVGFGESANDEMCFFWAYYYPSKGAFVCAHTDQVPGGFDICCPGPALCNQIFN